MNDLMIDLETLSTAPDAYILSIGACYFDLETGQIGENFHVKTSFYDTSNHTGHISASTVEWWLNQPITAQDCLLSGEKIDLIHALFKLDDFIKPGTKTLLSNGASFDLVILRNAFNRNHLETPWQYWQERDTRTIVDIAERITGINAKKTIPFNGTQHDALADAMYQAQFVSHAYQLIKNYTSTTL
jgi:hypothetical protein